MGFRQGFWAFRQLLLRGELLIGFGFGLDGGWNLQEATQEGSLRGETGEEPLLPGDDSLMPVFDHMLRALASELFGDFRPTPALGEEELDHFCVFLGRPLAVLFGGVQVVEPPLTALFARPEVAFSRLLVELPRELVPVVGCRCFPTDDGGQLLLLLGVPALAAGGVLHQFAALVLEG